MRKSHKITAGIGFALAGLIALGCSGAGNSTTPAAQVPNGSVSPVSPAAARQPVKLSGHGEGVVQANLAAGGYTLAYTSSGGFIIVTPVNADGSEGAAWVNGMGNGMGQPVSGTTVVQASGPGAIHVSNVDGSDWTLTFTPLG